MARSARKGLREDAATRWSPLSWKSTIIKLTVTTLLPVVSCQAVVTLGPRGAFSALTEARAVAPVVDGAHLIAVTFWKIGKIKSFNSTERPASTAICIYAAFTSIFLFFPLPIDAVFSTCRMLSFLRISDSNIFVYWAAEANAKAPFCAA